MVQNYKRQLEQLHIEEQLLFISLEKILDSMDTQITWLYIFVSVLQFCMLLIFIAGWLGLYFPKQFLNEATLLAAKMAITFSMVTVFLQVLYNWKWNQERKRDSRILISKQSREQRDAEEKSLLQRREELRNLLN